MSEISDKTSTFVFIRSASIITQSFFASGHGNVHDAIEEYKKEVEAGTFNYSANVLDLPLSNRLDHLVLLAYVMGFEYTDETHEIFGKKWAILERHIDASDLIRYSRRVIEIAFSKRRFTGPIPPIPADPLESRAWVLSMVNNKIPVEAVRQMFVENVKNASPRSTLQN